MSEQLKSCPFCGHMKANQYDPHSEECYFRHAIDENWQSRPIEDSLRTDNNALSARLAIAVEALSWYAATRKRYVRCFDGTFVETDDSDTARTALKKIKGEQGKEGK